MIEVPRYCESRGLKDSLASRLMGRLAVRSAGRLAVRLADRLAGGL